VNRVLLDTDVLIDLLRGRPVTRSFLFELTREATPCCSVITVAELHAGMREAERDVTTELLDGLIVFPVTRQIAEVAGALRRAAGRSATSIADGLIAATAVVEAMSVATGNVRHYRLPGVTVLRAP
jgi:tRNA(fMet)-specific endonuclease VapC